MSEEKSKNTITDLPQDTLMKSVEYLLNKDLASFAAVSKGYHGIFKPMLEINKLLLHVARGEQDQAEAMLSNNPDLALASGSVIDLSKRRFANITAFQYALWAMDWHMWRMLLKYLPTPEAAAQARDLKEVGTDYGPHFDLNELPKALNTFIEDYDRWNDVERIHHWCKVVGGAQRLLPAHVVNEYCHPDRSFYPTPTFTDTDTPLPRTRAIYVNKADDEWFSVLYSGGRIGDSFAVARGWRGMPYWVPCGLTAARSDHVALQSLSTVRTQQLTELFVDLSIAPPQEAKQGMR